MALTITDDEGNTYGITNTIGAGKYHYVIKVKCLKTGTSFALKLRLSYSVARFSDEQLARLILSLEKKTQHLRKEDKEGKLRNYIDSIRQIISKLKNKKWRKAQFNGIQEKIILTCAQDFKGIIHPMPRESDPHRIVRLFNQINRRYLKKTNTTAAKIVTLNPFFPNIDGIACAMMPFIVGRTPSDEEYERYLQETAKDGRIILDGVVKGNILLDESANMLVTVDIDHALSLGRESPTSITLLPILLQSYRETGFYEKCIPTYPKAVLTTLGALEKLLFTHQKAREKRKLPSAEESAEKHPAEKATTSKKAMTESGADNPEGATTICARP